MRQSRAERRAHMQTTPEPDRQLAAILADAGTHAEILGHLKKAEATLIAMIEEPETGDRVRQNAESSLTEIRSAIAIGEKRKEGYEATLKTWPQFVAMREDTRTRREEIHRLERGN